MQTTSRKQLGSRVDTNLNLSRYTSGLGVVRVEAAARTAGGNASGVSTRTQRSANELGNDVAERGASESMCNVAHSGFGIIKQNPANRFQTEQVAA